jgi:hypothetical protein
LISICWSIFYYGTWIEPRSASEASKIVVRAAPCSKISLLILQTSGNREALGDRLPRAPAICKEGVIAFSGIINSYGKDKAKQNEKIKI